MRSTNHGWRTVRNLVGLLSKTNRRSRCLHAAPLCMADMSGVDGMAVTPPNPDIPAELATNMSRIVETCNRLIEMISQLKDETVYVASPGFNDKAMTTLGTVIRDLESRDREVSWHHLTENQLTLSLLSVDPWHINYSKRHQSFTDATS